MWFKKSLLSKLLIGMLVAAIIPLSLSIFISYRTTSSSVQNQIVRLNEQAMDRNIYFLKRYLDDLDRIAISFYYNPVMMSYLRLSEIESSDYNRKLYLSNQIYAISKERPEFRAISFTDSQTGEVITDSTFLRLGEGYNLGAGPTTENDRAGWTETHGFDVVTVNGETLLAFHKPIIDYPRTTLLGVLSIYVGQDEIERLLRPFSGSEASEDGEVFLFIRKDSMLLYSSEPDASVDRFKELAAAKNGELEQGATGEGRYGFRELEWDGRSGVVIYMIDDYKGIPLSQAKFIPDAVVNEAANQALRQSLVIPFMTVAIVLVISFLLSYMLISPIRRLVRSIANVQAGNFTMQPVPKRQDELGVLEQRFQSMVRWLDDLMNREYRNRLELSTARLKMLQAQINPHFLYNSLQFIGTLALRKGVAEINDKIAELGSIMRYSMDIDAETVPLQQEIEHIEHYLSLQAGRFKNRLTYTLSYPDKALKIEVPKMILQPLVENSIIHGIEGGNGSGAIRIVMELDEALTIRVMDTGKGMQADAIERIRKEYGGRVIAEHERGIGLLNVLERLRLRYDAGFSWDIRSVPYEATVITLRILLQPHGARSGREEEAG
ncbi:sensor histidine kinase [Paenibacillaceae bacterium WGS1546]|uniref:cache domain-containing sensor histidine kinase n=1 Tax=Cohnella sp. WGS1546 TaxID=3366810 RepID=UPI00372CF028